MQQNILDLWYADEQPIDFTHTVQEAIYYMFCWIIMGMGKD